MSIKKGIALLTTAAVVTTGTASTCFAEGTVKDDLISQMADIAYNMVSEEMGEKLRFYSNIEMASKADTLPDRLDLRERGVVPEVRNQGDFGTCWSFASMGASEISILSDLGMTAQEFLEENGTELDLSEKHLAWFSTVPLQAQEGVEMTEDDLAQIGEGQWMLDENAQSVDHYQTGGFMGYASGIFASGVGPMTEEDIPYRNSEGKDSTAGDWSLDESMRFMSVWELKDSSILPTPAGRDENGNYVYNEIATEMIKQELLKGRGVSIVYHADMAMDPDAELHIYLDPLVDMGIPEESARLYLQVIWGEIEQEDLTEEENIEVIKVAMVEELNVAYEDIKDEVFEEMSDAYNEKMAEREKETETEEVTKPEEELEQEAAEIEREAREAAEKIDIDYDALMAFLGNDTEDDSEEGEADNEDTDAEIDEQSDEEADAEQNVYLNTDNYAQYVWNTQEGANHAVCIIGYDDNFPASAFLESNQPPADGAWIVRNSWGKSYGNDGYFYLSYYDQSIMAPETFEFVSEEETGAATATMINEYDFMPAAAISAGASKVPVYTANEYTCTIDSVLSYVSVMTANLDTNVTAAVYLLNEDSQTPIDGELLDVRTVDYEYAGYHRIPLSQHYMLPKGSRISVVQTQRYDDEDGMYYALPYTTGLNRAYYEVYNTLFAGTEIKETIAVEGRIGRGESFVGIDGEWYDWLDLVEEIGEVYPKAKEYVAFDNFAIKAYTYLLEDIESEHAFGEAVPYAGGSLRLCTDCGYALAE